MEQPDIESVTRSLQVVLQKERREALVYTLLTVLCTPAFVAIASLVIACAAVYFLRRSIGPIDRAMAMYTGVIIFLAWAIASVPVNAQRSPTGFAADRTWRAGVAVFLVLLVITYATPLHEHHPLLFGAAYVALSLLALGLAGQTQLNHPPPDVLRDYPAPEILRHYSRPDILRQAPRIEGFPLAVAGFVVAAYGELLSASWLWVPPKPHEVRLAARVLCRLAAESDRPLAPDTAGDRVVRLLFRLRLIEVAQRQLRLTPKGLDFLRTSAEVHGREPDGKTSHSHGE
jgi:hypothetical protein